MLPTKQRILKKHDFDLLKKRGQKIKSQNFDLVYLIRNDKENSRFGIIVSKKISKKAVNRNRIKRLFREAVKSNIMDIKKSYDFVCLVKQKALDKNLNDIKFEIGMLLKSNNFLK